MVLLVVLVYILSSRSSRPEGVVSLPVLAVFTLGVQRLFPALQEGYNSWATIAVLMFRSSKFSGINSADALSEIIML